MFTAVASAASLIAAGQLRALAVTSAERSPAFPQLPTVAEAGVPGYAAESWYGLFAPARTPKDRPPQQIRRSGGSIPGPQTAPPPPGARDGRAPARGARPIFSQRGRALAQGDPGRRDQGRVAMMPVAVLPRSKIPDRPFYSLAAIRNIR